MKGAGDSTIFVVLAFLAVSIFMAFSGQAVAGISEFVKAQTTETVANRMESGVYAISSVDKGELEMDFTENSSYNIWQNNSEKYMEYKMEGWFPVTQDRPDLRVRLNESFGTSYSINMDKDDDPVETICIVKDNDITVQGGEC